MKYFVSSQIFQFVFDSNVKVLEDHHLDRVRGLMGIFWNIKTEQTYKSLVFREL